MRVRTGGPYSPHEGKKEGFGLIQLHSPLRSRYSLLMLLRTAAFGTESNNTVELYGLFIGLRFGTAENKRRSSNAGTFVDKEDHQEVGQEVQEAPERRKNTIMENWLRPKGIDSHVRRKFMGVSLMPNSGYGTDKKTRHYLPNGFKKFLVQQYLRYKDCSQ
ncbi:hypothetical protein GIB67_001197 [Kingdonia uniflora]|uniref:Ribosomal protein L32 n=1 Tax=Kingdonia uniflora TaxID=39325 RepID=A0A7J7LG80_9MAGN|nr:hypothetical protein GIB67_001197 [Kingdonia uniflora]